MREATLSDDPGKLKECLDSLGNPHLHKREAEKMIKARGELAVKDLREKIKQCEVGRKGGAGKQGQGDRPEQMRKEEAPEDREARECAAMDELLKFKAEKEGITVDEVMQQFYRAHPGLAEKQAAHEPAGASAQGGHREAMAASCASLFSSP
jgi:hypothetical protein